MRRWHLFKRYYSNNERDFNIAAISLVAGVIIGMFVTVSGKQFGTMADWVSGIASSGAVITSLWLASGRLSRLTICHTIKKIASNSGENDIIIFTAYNKSDRPITLEFYGYKKKNRKAKYIRPIEFKPEVIASGAVQRHEITIEEVTRSLDLKNYTGKIEACFAEPDGTKHTEIINWKNLLVSMAKLEVPAE